MQVVEEWTNIRHIMHACCLLATVLLEHRITRLTSNGWIGTQLTVPSTTSRAMSSLLAAYFIHTEIALWINRCLTRVVYQWSEQSEPWCSEMREYAVRMWMCVLLGGDIRWLLLMVLPRRFWRPVLLVDGKCQTDNRLETDSVPSTWKANKRIQWDNRQSRTRFASLIWQDGWNGMEVIAT